GFRQGGSGGTVFPDQCEQLPLYQKKRAQDPGDPKKVYPVFGKPGNRGGTPVAFLPSIEILPALHKEKHHPYEPVPPPIGPYRKENRFAPRGPAIRLWGDLGRAARGLICVLKKTGSK